MKKIILLAIPLVAFFVGIGGAKAANYEIVVQNREGASSVNQFPTEDQVVKGSKFKLTNEKGTMVAEWTADGDKKITVTSPGKYTLIEETPAPGYQSLKRSIETFITEEQNSENVIKTTHYPTIVIVNAPVGMVYDLYDNNGDKIWTWKQVNPTMTLERLKSGTYTIKIVKFQDDYQFSEEMYKKYKDEIKTFVVDKTHEFQTLNFTYSIGILGEPPVIPSEGLENGQPTATEPEAEKLTNVPNTLSTESSFLYGIGAFITLLGSGFVYKYVKQNGM